MVRIVMRVRSRGASADNRVELACGSGQDLAGGVIIVDAVMSRRAIHAVIVLTFAAFVHAQHIQFGQPINGIPIANPALDRSGNLLLLSRNIALGLGPAPSQPVILLDRYGRDGSQHLLADTLMASAGETPVLLAVDIENRVYVGANREGQPVLVRFHEDGSRQRTELFVPLTRLTGIAFAPNGDPVVIGTEGTTGMRVVRLDSARLIPVAQRLLTGRVGAPRAVAVDRAGAVYIAGDAVSREFDATPGAFQQGCHDCTGGAPFVTKLSPDLQTVVYSTLLSDRGISGASAIQVSGDGTAYVAGWIIGGGGDSPFPTTPGAFQRRLPREFELWTGGHGMILGPSAAFIARLNPQGSALIASTLLGGSLSESISGLALDEQGRVIVHGSTHSRDFPTTGVFQRQCGPDRGRSYNATFLTRLDARLERVEKSIVAAEVSSLGLPNGPIRGPFLLAVAGSAAGADLDRDEAAEVACVVSGASYEGLERLTPGQLLTVFGRSLGPDRLETFEGGGPLPMVADSTRVLFNGMAAPILAAHSFQLNVVVPQEVKGNVWMEIERNGERIFGRHFRWSSNSPEPLLRITGEGGAIHSPASPYVLLSDAVNEDGTLNSASNPAPAGSTVTVYVSGLGTLDANMPDNGYGDDRVGPVQDYVVTTESGRIEPVDVRTVPGRTVAVAAVRFRIPPTQSGALHFSIEPSYSTINFSPKNFVYVRSRE